MGLLELVAVGLVVLRLFAVLRTLWSNLRLPTANSMAAGITAGPDGNLWFAEYHGNKIGRITTSGTITEFPILTTYGGPEGITAGPDGNLWFAEYSYGKIGRITTAGAVTEFQVPGTSSPWRIATGPDGNLWFTDLIGDKIGRITTAGTITEFSVQPHPLSPRASRLDRTGLSGSRKRLRDKLAVSPQPAPSARPDPNREWSAPRYRARTGRRPVVHRNRQQLAE